MKNKNALSLLIAANAVSGFAQGISMLAIPWYFSDILHASSTFGMIYGIATCVTLFWGLYVGTLVDKYPRKNIFMIVNLCGGLVVGSVALSGFYLGEVPTALIGAVFCSTLFTYNIHYPTLYAFGQEITEKKDYGRINSLIEVQGQSISVLSGAFAAILITGVNQQFLDNLGISSWISINIEPWSLHEIFLMDAITYFIAFILVSLIRYTPVKEKSIDTGSVYGRLKQGARFLKDQRLLFYFGVCSYAIFAMLLIHIHQLMPIYVNKHLNASSAVYAGAEMFYAAGALLSGIGIRWVFRNTTTTKAVIILMIVSILMFELTAFSSRSWILAFVCFILGITNAGTRVLRITYLFNHIPNHIIGRSGSVFQTLNVLTRLTFISLFSLTFFSRNDNIIWAYFICGIFIFLALIPLLIHYKKLVNLQPEA
ncbi:MAG: MFS transporter [Flavobacteriales bacterium]|nr:MFS transporter [Flavobacteriales bacterium]